MKYLFAHLLYVLGDLVSRSKLMETSFGYSIYNSLMVKSSDLQTKWNLSGPWVDVQSSMTGCSACNYGSCTGACECPGVETETIDVSFLNTSEPNEALIEAYTDFISDFSEDK